MLTWSKSTNERIRTWLHCWTERRTREFISRKWPDSQYSPFNQTEMAPSYLNFCLKTFFSKQYHSVFFYSTILWKYQQILLQVNIPVNDINLEKKLSSICKALCHKKRQCDIFYSVLYRGIYFYSYRFEVLRALNYTFKF